MSVSPQKILNEISLAIGNGKTIFYLLSDDCGSYGIDIETNFSILLESILALDPTIQVNITNIYPLFLLKFYDSIKKHIYANRIQSILVPLQHSSKRILALMNRNYDIEKITKILIDIKANSNTELINHLIFDYHNETLEEIVDTFKLLQFYDKNFYFRYSDINHTYGKDHISVKLKEKIILLKKLQRKYNIDITL